MGDSLNFLFDEYAIHPVFLYTHTRFHFCCVRVASRHSLRSLLHEKIQTFKTTLIVGTQN